MTARSRHLLCGAAVVVLGTFAGLSASAETFTCPNKGGDMVFGQEAQVAGLDMHFSSAISARCSRMRRSFFSVSNRVSARARRALMSSLKTESFKAA